VADREFLFALHLSDESRFEAMVADLTASVLGYAGYAVGVIAQLDEALRASVARARIPGECDVQFWAHAGDLEIAVSQANRRIFHASWRLP